jgi:hypothetical protein
VFFAQYHAAEVMLSIGKNVAKMGNKNLSKSLKLKNNILNDCQNLRIKPLK